MKHVIIIAAIIFLLPQLAISQTLAEAYLISNQRINGTARAGAMGNAFGALGGDITSLSINPAGIGIYRTGEFVFTPLIQSNNSELTFNGQTFTDSKFKIKLNNFGLTGLIKINDGNSGIVSFNYGFGYNNVLDFNQNFYGMNGQSSNSFLDGIENDANSEGISNSYLNQNIGAVDFNDWPLKLAWDAWLINPAVDDNGDDVDGEYWSVLNPNEKVDQKKSYFRTGGIDEFILTGGLNINHQFYMGATVGIQNVDLNQRTEYTETFDNNGQGEENSYTFGDEYSLKGTGYNFKFGAIFKPIDNIRLGASVHTPTYYALDEQKNIWLDSRLLKNESFEGINLYDYNFFSPWKAVLSGAYIFGKMGLISIDAEYIDYSTMRFRRSINSNEDLSDVNRKISNSFENSLNIRVGGEFKITPQFSLRGGYELYPNKQEQDPSVFQPIALDNSSVLALGFGFASKRFFTDFAFRRVTDKYSLNEVQPNFEDMDLTNNNNKLIFTLGYKF